MDQNLATILLVIASILGFFIYIAPTTNAVEELELKMDKFMEVAEKAESLAEKEDELKEDHETYVDEYQDGINSIVPVGRDDARTLMDINSIAGANDALIREARITDMSRDAERELNKRRGDLPYSAKTVQIKFDATYEDFAGFLTSLERSRKLFEPVSVKFTGSSANVYEFEMMIKSYWVKG
ncbi:MAG: hypothetical protein ACQESA_03200 [Patescibacteria group bacterium]